MTDRPNILCYCSDQQRFDTIGALNNPHVHTPRLDAFMKESVTFDYAYCHLEAVGERENTIVVYMSDHGLLLKGRRFFEGLTRVPLMISYPAKFKENVVSDALVELIDLVATFLDSVGLDIPFWVQGPSLANLLAGSTDTHREFVRTEFFGAIYATPPFAPRAMPF